MGETINWGDPVRKERSYDDRRSGGGRRFDRGSRDRDRGPSMPMPINFLANMLDTKVTLIHWMGNELSETEGRLKALDGSGNTVLEVDGKLTWYRGATVQRIEFKE